MSAIYVGLQRLTRLMLKQSGRQAWGGGTSRQAARQRHSTQGLPLLAKALVQLPDVRHRSDSTLSGGSTVQPRGGSVVCAAASSPSCDANEEAALVRGANITYEDKDSSALGLRRRALMTWKAGSPSKVLIVKKPRNPLASAKLATIGRWLQARGLQVYVESVVHAAEFKVGQPGCVTHVLSNLWSMRGHVGCSGDHPMHLQSDQVGRPCPLEERSSSKVLGCIGTGCRAAPGPRRTLSAGRAPPTPPWTSALPWAAMGRSCTWHLCLSRTSRFHPCSASQWVRRHGTLGANALCAQQCMHSVACCRRCVCRGFPLAMHLVLTSCTRAGCRMHGTPMLLCTYTARPYAPRCMLARRALASTTQNSDIV